MTTKAISHDPSLLNGTGKRIGIVYGSWNTEIVDSLKKGCVETCLALGVAEKDIYLQGVPGSFELPLAAKLMAEKWKLDSVICIGVLIKGETMHFEYISHAVSTGIMNLGLEIGVPVVFGVLTCLNTRQAMARAGLTSEGSNHGVDWAKTAIHMSNIQRSGAMRRGAVTIMGRSKY